MNIVEFRKKVRSELASFLNEREANAHLSILFEKILGLNKAEFLIAEVEGKSIGREEQRKMNESLNELRKHKPIDYLFNESIFFGRSFFVDERVLIPRSETEELVQWILEEEAEKKIELLDIGSGSGCISITLGLEGGFKKVDAVDVSEEANQVARINAERNRIEMDFRTLDILKELPDQRYDIVVSNPPYVRREELSTLDKNVVEYEPEIALSPNGEPLLFYRRMIEIAPIIMKSKARFYWEIHEDLGKEVMQLLQQNKFQEIELREDIYGRDRLVRAVYPG